MNPNRQNNCFAGRQGGRPVNVIAAPVCNAPVQTVSCCNNAVNTQTVSCCNNTVNTQTVPCCSDVAAGGIIVGGCADPGCNKETVLNNLPVAMAYVPWQSYGNVYPMQQALRNGTMFAELNLDFAGRRCN